MPGTALALIAVDLIALTLLTLMYYRRHRRRDLVAAFVGINVGVLAVTAVLGTAEIAMGLGLGLFGVLSIIRLRSSEISQREVAYYFASLAMGLIGGLATTSVLLPSVLIALIVAVMWAADHPALLARSRHQVVRFDRAVCDETELRAELEQRLGGTVTSLTVQQLDLVNDSTLVDVRYRLGAGRSASRSTAGSARSRRVRASVESGVMGGPGGPGGPGLSGELAGSDGSGRVLRETAAAAPRTSAPIGARR